MERARNHFLLAEADRVRRFGMAHDIKVFRTVMAAAAASNSRELLPWFFEIAG
jgi:hypothetical protein